MLENRHAMSQSVRDEVLRRVEGVGIFTGLRLHPQGPFSRRGDPQIEQKVVNRLRQVTSAIKQDGTNQVNIIASTAEMQAAVEFAKAAAMRPQIVGAALQGIWKDPVVANAFRDPG